MSVETQPIVCSLCAAAFSFTDDEKQFQMIRSIVGKPVLCPRCRGANLNEKVPGYSFPFLCMGCHVSSRVRFQPRGTVAMYCEKCLLIQLRAVTFGTLPDSKWTKPGTRTSALRQQPVESYP
ncbi:MAG: zinc-ribbon domain containing protein [Dehalococcoidia bacterium]|jgi:hypothetical protein|uniref:zinc-ribbon domain containing protein n=1 Tax=Candidatus Amarobacter glycogenicus TaxID=3140699 RepID=UPI001DAAD092|nr:zinc-ribbon domain containing protein [Dehalococcoidia bacterium]MBK6562255.1 zinc-ribbon domain containing protein [Dehalococcoidia bacterium]MBK7724696.1 zinc-ribbon domain containing protein [Dehalococcoidia bacterium]MBK8561325.1 zinc-ribbon domain containing protein [Dehalococcoidia bacterium]MBK9544376.1 zinc-ribbon domain containing protein [Dehalococcoidia bacterium]